MNDNEPTAFNFRHSRISAALHYLMAHPSDEALCIRIESDWLIWTASDHVVLQHEPSGDSYHVDGEPGGVTHYVWTANVIRLPEAVRIAELFQRHFSTAFGQAMWQVRG